MLLEPMQLIPAFLLRLSARVSVAAAALLVSLGLDTCLAPMKSLGFFRNACYSRCRDTVVRELIQISICVAGCL